LDAKEYWDSLTPEERTREGRRRGGINLHRNHPEIAKEAGRKGGLAKLANHPEMKTSSWGKQLVAQRSQESPAIRKERLRKAELAALVAAEVQRALKELAG
jgi:hypothetical protein